MANTQNQWPWKAEYARSGRSLCRTCYSTIESKKLRLGQMVQSTKHDGRIPLWNHADCILKTANQIESIDDVENLVDLRWEDQQKIRKYIESSATPKLNAVKDTECGIEVSRTSPAMNNGDGSGTKVEAEEVKGEACDLENRQEAQSKELWALKDDLEKLVTTSELSKMLKANDQDTTGSKLDLCDRCADGMMFGGLGHCPLCSGFLRYFGGMYRCSGYFSEWSKCSYTTVEPKRAEEIWKIPEEPDNPYLKEWFKYQKGKKPVRILSLPSSRNPDESQITACPHQSSNGESLGDLKVAISGLPLKIIV